MIDDVAAYIAFRTVYDFLLAQFDALAFGWLSRMLTWVHGIASGLLTLHLAWQGYQLITGNVSASAAARLTDTWRAVVILGLAMGTTLGGTTLFEWLGTDLVRAVAAVVHGGDGDVLAEIDRSFGYLQLALSSIDWIQASTAEIQAAKARDMGLVTLGIGGPALMGGALLLTFQIALSLFVGLGPLFVLCLIWRRTRPLFDGWLLYGLGTMFSLATLAVMLEMTLPMVSAVAAAFWTATWTGANPEGVTSLALQQGGIGVILTMMIIGAPVMAAKFFKATLGEFMPFSAFMNRMDDRRAAAAHAHTPTYAREPGRSHALTPTHAHRVSVPTHAATQEGRIKPAEDSRSFLGRYPNATASLDSGGGQGDAVPEAVRASWLSQGDTSTRSYSAADIDFVVTERTKTPSGGYLEKPRILSRDSDEYAAAKAKFGESSLKEVADAANALGQKLTTRGNKDEIEVFNSMRSIAIEVNPDKAHKVSYSAKAKDGLIYINPGIFLDYTPLRQANRMAHEFRHFMPANVQMAADDYAAFGSKAEDDAKAYAKELFGKESQ
ncbi:type IV secretion system protein [Luteimonas sp. SX5]|uniref:Type IV secretion system protein n=1 Tax=Luteimonas galliterrae TaxID=2940486 RepID=A0ABT0MIU5_9GAMM|nr:type IV secretion system protein [Luteimonas galliterrae]MCL1634781.1 type IV secretion system protein [Luteimonas galliterrae]